MYLVYQNPELQFITNSVYDEINIHFNHLSKDQSDDETIQLLKLLDLQNVKINILMSCLLVKNDALA